MKATEHGDHLVKLTRLGVVNCYLVREPDGLTLIDTGITGSAKKLIAAADDLGQPITHIALTHSHSDHAGSLDALAALLPDAEVSIGVRESRLMAGDMSLDPDEPQAKPAGGFPKLKTVPGRTLAPGDRVGSLEVVAAPGHTPGQIAFLDVRDRTLVAGDALQTLGGVAVAGIKRPLFPFPAMATWDLATSLETAVNLRALEPARLAIGHGGVLEQPAAAVEAAIEVAALKVKARARAA
jgi:glyoxylase-like metal-dependent hydrolase (beta-lactamase superfamily II)